MVLMDFDCSHNILQPRMVGHLQLPTSSTPKFSTMVGNREQLQGQGMCHNIPITLQVHSFSIPFYLLQI